MQVRTPTIVEIKMGSLGGNYKFLRSDHFRFFTQLSALASKRVGSRLKRSKVDEAEERAKEYAQELNDVQAFSIGSGWYAIAMGPISNATSAG